MAPQISSTILSIALILALILTVLWIALPFAVFGIKDRLDKINGQLIEIKKVLQSQPETKKPPQ